MVRFTCSALKSTSFCLLSALVSWTRWVNTIDLLLFRVLTFASSLTWFGAEQVQCPPCIEILFAFAAHFWFISAVHISGDSCPCVSADSRWKPSLVVENGACWVAGSCLPLHVPLLYGLLILRSLVGGKCLCSWFWIFWEILWSLLQAANTDAGGFHWGHTYSARLTLFRFPVSSTVCCRHPFQVQICLSTTTTAAGNTPRSDSEGSGVSVSAQRHCWSCKIWKAEGIASPPSPSFCRGLRVPSFSLIGIEQIF